MKYVNKKLDYHNSPYRNLFGRQMSCVDLMQLKEIMNQISWTKTPDSRSKKKNDENKKE